MTTIRLVVLLLIFPEVQGLFSQTVINTSHQDENRNYISCDYILAPGENNSVEISGNSRVNYISESKIVLKPGFSASGLTDNGFFKARTGESNFEVLLLEPDSITNEAGRFEKIEFGVILPDSIKMLVDTFMNNPPESVFEEYIGLNPFDPEDISIEAHFSMPDYPGKAEKVAYGFYYKDYSYINLTADQAYWVEDDTEINWRLRFAPDQVGTWNVSILVTFPAHPELESLYYFCYEFECIPSSNPGFIKRNENNGRMLKFSGTGEQFFGLGLNVAWPRKWISPASGYYYVNDPLRFIEHRDYIRNIGMNNGNMVRIVISPFDYNFEWEKLNYYDSKIDIDTVGWATAPESYDKVGRLALAYELDSLLLLCEDLDVYVVICHEHHFQFGSSHPNPSGYLNYPYIWPNNPYKTIPGIDSVTDFLTQEIARKYYRHKIRYILSRWGYSKAILGHELISEIDQINCVGAYDQQDNKAWSYCPYYDGSDKGIQFIEDLEDWHLSMLEYIRDPRYLNYTQHLYSTSYATLPRYPDDIPLSIDFVNWHPYSSDPLRHRTRYLTLTNYFLSNPELWDKPFYIGETGLSGSTPNGCPSNGFYACDDLAFHNDMWVTSMLCGMSSGMHWWWDKGIVDYQLHVLEPLQVFFDSIDLVNNAVTDIGSNWDIENPFANPDTVQYYFARTENHDLIYGWIHNYDVHWKNFITVNESCLVSSEPGWSESCIPQDTSIVDTVYAELIIEDISGDHTFSVKKFNTRTGSFYPTENYTSSNGKLTIPFGYLGNKPQDTDNPTDYGFIIQKN